ncbi:hypothetical protein P154DRAFT_525293 [Amniculicola lignicola CBS 123094]|uniref:LYC1 C-terminal domain-containing protein n=1 Tax=Amniculicola lignicola CBS 123094 TaxID=1392246 RepID=A0A6A5W7Y3_9PLEO|nr:hypothetical protein P154DRAFT_525293 [Amniculicola lignicola CBS 123094]
MGSILNLPDGSSPTLALVQPTDEEKLFQFKLNAVEWRGALSMEAYLRREEVLSQQSLTQDGGISYWILVDTSAKQNPLDPAPSARLPLASCETYRKKALVCRDGQVQETVSHGVGSVFCAPNLRKRGYAQRLMQEVGKMLQTYQTTEKECLFTVLYSDIGKKFYAGFGWEPFHSAHISVPGKVSKVADLPPVRPLFDEDLEELCEIDVALVRKSLESRPKNSRTAVALVPDIETIRWHHAREDFVGMELHGKCPKIKGAIVGSEVGKRIWCYWTRVWYNSDPTEAKGNTLHILRLVVEDQLHKSCEETTGTNGASGHQGETAAIAALMAAAQQEAEEWKLEEVETWTPSAATVAAAQMLDAEAKVINRDMESIASLKWYPQHEKPVAESIDWMHMEKFVWC